MKNTVNVSVGDLPTDMIIIKSKRPSKEDPDKSLKNH